MSKLVITVGETVGTADQRLLENLRRAKNGETVEINTRIDFADAKTMFSMLNANRFAVLAFVADHNPKSINAIATGLGRGYRRVHQDVQALLDLGLIDRLDDGLFSVGFDPRTLSIEVAA